MNILELASEVLEIPMDSQENIEFLEYAVWEHTGYPNFYRGDPEQYFRQQLQEFKDKGFKI